VLVAEVTLFALACLPFAFSSLNESTHPSRGTVSRDKVDITGVVTLRHNSRLHHVGIGRRLVGTRVLVLVDGLEVRVITEDGELLRSFTLDPTKDYQARSPGEA
jgi:hypothetical protein